MDDEAGAWLALVANQSWGLSVIHHFLWEMADKKDRIPIPDDIATAVLVAADRKCCVCREPRLDLQIHHIDDDPSNNDQSNLAVLCLQHHNDTQKKGGFGRHLNASQIKEYKRLWEVEVAQSRQTVTIAETEKGEEPQGSKLPERNFERVEYSVLKDDQGKYVIAGAPTVFFSDRMAYTFPGLTGLRIIDDPKGAAYRLKRLLHSPVHFEEAIGHGRVTDPIWYTRGLGDMYVHKLEAIADDVLLMNEQELRIKRIAAFNSSGGYYQAFVYVELEAMAPSGAYNHSEASRKDWMERYGYHFEEYGWLDGRAFDLRYHDDGYMEVDDEVRSVEGSVRRRRYLSPYNFLIVPKTSPLRVRGREREVERMLNGILKGEMEPDVLADYVSPLPKSDWDD